MPSLPSSVAPKILFSLVFGATASLAVALACNFWHVETVVTNFDLPVLDLDHETERWRRDAPVGMAGPPVEIYSQAWLGGSHSLVATTPFDIDLLRDKWLVVRAGLPFTCLEGVRWIDHDTKSSSESQLLLVSMPVGSSVGVLPYGIRPIGLLANSLVFTIPSLGVALLTSRLRRRWRASRGACGRCGHPLAGAKTCQECGAGTEV